MRKPPCRRWRAWRLAACVLLRYAVHMCPWRYLAKAAPSLINDWRRCAVAAVALVVCLRMLSAEARADTAKPGIASLETLLQRGTAQERAVLQLIERLGQAGTAQAKREQQAAQLAEEIEKLKVKPPGVTRDLELGEQLAQAQTQASELAAAAAAARRLAAELVLARQRLVAICDQILDAEKSASLSSAQRFYWLRLRTAQVEALLGNGSDRKVRALAESELGGIPGPATALDDPLVLHERADLLRDAADKLHREVLRLTARREELQRRQRLRERASRVDEDLFAEQSTARRGGSHGSASEKASPAAADAAGPGPLTTMTPSSAPLGNSPVRGGPDPATLDGLLRLEGPGEPAAKLQALSQAQGELETLAADLMQRAERLEERARELRQKK